MIFDQYVIRATWNCVVHRTPYMIDEQKGIDNGFSFLRGRDDNVYVSRDACWWPRHCAKFNFVVQLGI